MSEETEPVDLASDEIRSETDAWQDWLKDLARVSSTLSQLAAAEMRLAASDLRRYFLLSLLMLPVMLLAWIGFSVLLAWLAYNFSTYPAAGFGTFFLLQLLVLFYMRKLLARYRSSLSLPVTRRQLKLMLEDGGIASGKSDT